MTWVLAASLVFGIATQGLGVYAQGQGPQYDCVSGIVDLFTDPARTLQLGTFTCKQFPTNTPVPTEIPTPTPTVIVLPDVGPLSPVPTIIPSTGSKQYCVDEDPGTVTIESCDDSTRCDIAHGSGGPAGACGTVISHEHNIIEFLLGTTSKYFNSLSNIFSTTMQTNCGTAAAANVPYISTFNVVDSYTLAGLGRLDRGAHAQSSALEAFWRSNPEFTILPDTRGLTPGDVMIFGSGHVGIVNTVEIDDRGNGDIWFLHTNATYYLGKVMTANWSVVASSTGDTNVVFGSHTLKGPDATIGQTICYCGNICYQWVF